MSRITAYCRINENHCTVNNTLLATREENPNGGWFKQLYRELELAYPKFHKMDVLAQAGIIATELIKRSLPGMPDKYADDEIALLFANRSSSADTDVRFKNSYEQNGAPSPALFVYTLPNIVLGEIAIANKWYGENMFVVLPKFAPDFFVSYAEILLSTGSKAVLCGWVDVLDDKMEIFVFLVENESAAGLEFNVENQYKLTNF